MKIRFMGIDSKVYNQQWNQYRFIIIQLILIIY